MWPPPSLSPPLLPQAGHALVAQRRVGGGVSGLAAHPPPPAAALVVELRQRAELDRVQLPGHGDLDGRLLRRERLLDVAAGALVVPPPA